MSAGVLPQQPTTKHSDVPFLIGLGLIGSLYLGLIIAFLIADLANTSPDDLVHAFTKPEIRAAVRLSLLSCSLAAVLSLCVAIPLGYILARTRFPGHGLVDLILDVPIVLPPLVIGLSLLILLQTPPGLWFQRHVIVVTYAVPGVVLAQVTVAAAFAVRTMKATFEQIDPRTEDIARTLGCTQWQAFWRVTLPDARSGVLTAFTVAWARSLGEFGPILLFCGATRMKTEVLSTSVFLELSHGNLGAALAVSLLMIAVAVIVLLVTRSLGLRGSGLI